MLWTCDTCGKEAEHTGSPAKMGDPPPEGWLKEQRGSQITSQCEYCSVVRQRVMRMFDAFWQRCREEAKERGVPARDVAREMGWYPKRSDDQTVIDDEWLKQMEEDFKE